MSERLLWSDFYSRIAELAIVRLGLLQGKAIV
jgi:hypothetical protein